MFLDFFGVATDSPRRERDGVYHAEVIGPPGTARADHPARHALQPLARWRGRRTRRTTWTADVTCAAPTPPPRCSGAEQWAWLEEQLRVPAQVRIIGSSIQVVDEDTSGETWANFPLERKRLFKLLWRTDTARSSSAATATSPSSR